MDARPIDDAADRLSAARDAADAGAAVAADYFREDVPVETKSHATDVVTRADREAQDAVVAVLRDRYPDDVVVGEEGDGRESLPDAGPAWVVDPIDGTNNFVREVPVWATSVAAVVDGRPVAAVNLLPALGDSYVADDADAYRNGDRLSVSDVTDPEAGVVAPSFWWGHDRREEYAAATEATVREFGDLRRYGCSQAALSLVAAGGLDGVFTNCRTNPWDTVAGVHLIRRAGGRVTDLAGDPWRHDSVGLVASNGALHDRVLAAARAAAAAE
jgi:myo-inositol-1(or 4)-monophosphatase